MGKFAIIVLGSAGSGKSTACGVLAQHYSLLQIPIHLVNLDPAALIATNKQPSSLPYEPSIDVRDVINLSEIMSEEMLGPNGGLVSSLEFLFEETTWLEDSIGDFEDDLLLIDTPGQIELLIHIPVMPRLVQKLHRLDYRVVALMLVDGPTTTAEPTRFVATQLLTLTTQVSLEETPFVAVLSKGDLLPKGFDETALERFEAACLSFSNGQLPTSFQSLTNSISDIVHDYSLVSYDVLNLMDEDAVGALVNKLNSLLQYEDDAEVRDTFE